MSKMVGDQGTFGFCSLYAVSFSVSHSLLVKYGIAISGDRIVDMLMQKPDLHTSLWADEVCELAGTIYI